MNSGERIRVLRVIARMNLGGPAYHVSLLSGQLDPDRYETLLIAGKVPEGEASAAALAERYGADLRSLDSLGPELRPLRDLRAFLALRRIVKDFKPHVVHTHTAKAGLLARAAARSVRPAVPVVVHTYHGHVLEGYFSAPVTWVFRTLERLLARRSSCLIGVSQATIDDLVRLGVAPASKFRHVPLGLDLEVFAELPSEPEGELRKQLNLGPELLLTYIGRLVSIKRLDLMLAAFARARHAGVPVQLAIVGDGEARESLEQLALRLDIASAVHFLGYRTDLPEILRATDIAILSSRNEGTPVFLIEAAAAGRPAVATAVGGVDEVVRPETGLVVPFDAAVAGLAEAIQELAGDADLRQTMGVAARSRVLERYSQARLLSDIDALYEELSETVA